NPELPEKFRQAKAKRQTAPGSAPAKSVAVLPFVNMSADKHDEYLSDGMTEELINALAKVPGLRVPGRTSCFAFKGKTEADIFRDATSLANIAKPAGPARSAITSRR